MRMIRSRMRGDSTDRWRESYGRVSKDLLRDVQDTNRSRLRLMGVDALDRRTRILDVGAGDGNLFTTLRAEGFSQAWGFEYQKELAVLHPQRCRIVVASATDIPFATGSMGAVVVMDVLHHLTQSQLSLCFAEVRRVLQAGGLLFVCEPAGTPLHRVLTLLLMSPLSRLSSFSRDKRAMVEAEKDTLQPWLESEHGIPARVAAGGFRIEFFRRYWLHHYGRFRAI